MLFCSCDGSDTNDSLFLLMETFVQVIAIIYDSVLGNVKCEVLNSIAFVPLHFHFLVILFGLKLFLSQVFDA